MSSRSPTASLFIVKQIMILPIFITHISSELFNLTSFSVISDPSGYETIEWDDEGEYAGGGGTLDGVVMNNWPDVYVRMYVSEGKVEGLAIMADNDVLQTKYITYMQNGIAMSSISIDDTVHIIIENVTKHMGTEWNDKRMYEEKETTTITINDGSDSDSYGTWTSTIVPENVTVKLDCKIVNNSNSIITAKCISETTWGGSVFNRIPIYLQPGGIVGSYKRINRVLFGKDSFSTEGSITQSWDGSTQFNITGSGTNLIFDDQLTITGLPESFVNYWVNMRAEALLEKDSWGDIYAMLVPPDS